MLRSRELGVYSPARYRETVLQNQFLSITYRDSEDDLLLYCSVIEILDEPCSFSQLFLEVSEEAFTMRNTCCRSPSLTQIVFQIVTLLESLLDVFVHYIPAEYQYIKFLLNLIWPNIKLNIS